MVPYAFGSSKYFIKNFYQKLVSFTNFIFFFYSNYPEKRHVTDSDGLEEGVVGNLKLLQHNTLSSQPISSLDWSSDKLGLAVCTSFDQCVRVILTTKLNLY